MWSVISKTSVAWDSYSSTSCMGLFETETKADEFIEAWEAKDAEVESRDDIDTDLRTCLQKQWVPIKENEPVKFHTIYTVATSYDVGSKVREIESMSYFIVDNQRLPSLMESNPEYRIAFENPQRAVEISSTPESILFEDSAPTGKVGEFIEDEAEELSYIWQDWITLNPESLTAQPES